MSLANALSNRSVARIGLVSGSTPPSGNWWDVSGATPVVAYKARSAASLSASYVNLVNPGTNNAAPGTVPTLVAAGWQFDGGSMYLIATGVIPAAGWSMIIKFSSGNTGSGGWVAGTDATGGNNAFYLSSSFSSKRLYANGDGQFGSLSSAVSSGVLAVAGLKAYYNGVDEGITFGAWSGTQTNPVYFGGLNSGGSFSNGLAVTIEYVAIYSTVLSPTDVATLTVTLNTNP